MHAFDHKVSQRSVDGALAVNPVHPFKLLCDNLDGEMRFSAAIVSGMSAMMRTIVDHAQLGWI